MKAEIEKLIDSVAKHLECDVKNMTKKERSEERRYIHPVDVAVYAHLSNTRCAEKDGYHYVAECWGIISNKVHINCYIKVERIENTFGTSIVITKNY